MLTLIPQASCGADSGISKSLEPTDQGLCTTLHQSFRQGMRFLVASLNTTPDPARDQSVDSPYVAFLATLICGRRDSIMNLTV